MKKDFAKLYDGLTDKEKASLAFGYLTETNALELERVGAAVSRKTYSCHNMEYWSWFDGFFHMAALWSLQRWKNYAHMLEAYILTENAVRDEEYDKLKSRIDETLFWSSRLLALDKIIDGICEEHGFDAAAVRKLAGADTFTPFFGDTTPDAKYLKEMTEALSAMLPG